MRGESAKPDKYLVVKNVGHSSGHCNSGILIVRNRRTGATYIEKKLTRTAIETELGIAEVNFLRRLQDCEYITKLVEAGIDHNTQQASMWLRYYEQGSLEDLIKRHEKRCEFISEVFVWKVFIQVARAVHYCHYGPGGVPWRAIIHRDLKPGNVMLTMRHGDMPEVRVGDFGCAIGGAMSREMEEVAFVLEGDPEYRPPESPVYYTESDVFQVGYIVACMVHLGFPRFWQGMNGNVRREWNAILDEKYTSTLRKALGRCMKEIYSDRISSRALPGYLERKFERVMPGLSITGRSLILRDNY